MDDNSEQQRPPISLAWPYTLLQKGWRLQWTTSKLAQNQLCQRLLENMLLRLPDVPNTAPKDVAYMIALLCSAFPVTILKQGTRSIKSSNDDRSGNQNLQAA